MAEDKKINYNEYRNKLDLSLNAKRYIEYKNKVDNLTTEKNKLFELKENKDKIQKEANELHKQYLIKWNIYLDYTKKEQEQRNKIIGMI
jgi:hypothetical protein